LIADAIAELGKLEEINRVLMEFQKYFYQPSSVRANFSSTFGG